VTRESIARRHQASIIRHASPEYRDQHLNSGMEDGLQDALTMVEQVARSL